MFLAQSLEPVNDGQWHHVAMTLDAAAGRLALYVDGILNSAVELEKEIEKIVLPITCIGRSGAPDSKPMYLEAGIDEVYLYRRALHPGEVMMLSRPDRESNKGQERELPANKR
ncbi:MAG: hypothetical protein PHR35_21065 [Kiritimatiellae bacterium]|nr:hypothetical protein [Kiritimatiellia bacterium]